MGYAKYYLKAQKRELMDNLSGRKALREFAEENGPSRIYAICMQEAAEQHFNGQTYEDVNNFNSDSSISAEPAIINAVQAEAVEDVDADNDNDTKGLTKLEKQQKAILKVIENKGFKPMAIPDGEKTGTIQRACENKYATLFKGSTSFDRAWKLGLKSNLWKMENHESYARRGNN